MTHERDPANAGTFYPENPDSLASLVRTLLDAPVEDSLKDLDPETLRAVIVPHGEYVRSGQVAASAYRLLGKRKRKPERVLIVAPLHYWPEYGLILPTFPSYRIPTGSLPVDRKTIQQLAFFSETLFSDEAHLFEHSIETQLPFLQAIWGPVPIVPLGYADLPADVLARILDPFFEDPETIVLISADFSRYFDAVQAELIDRESIERICSGQKVDPLHVCGSTGINALGIQAKKRSLLPRLLRSANSKEASGEGRQTTGYASFGFAG
ncbi:MAG: AmmeMemoRadiSam system protein B [Nitrospirae bacterium]|nr:AmmeMemoRadiSam system protein B [Nitrospirota bacterium]MCL5285442.1 AmmeMemoRadiSam system protein B [Nitrospirota bacterium]